MPTLIEECHALVQELQPELAGLFLRQTRRQNFILFSLYSTDLSLLNFHSQKRLNLGPLQEGLQLLQSRLGRLGLLVKGLHHLGAGLG